MTSSVYQTADNFGPQPDPVTQIRQALELLTEPGQVIEIRIPETGRTGTVAGYFNDPAQAAKAAAHWSGKAPCIYFTLNPCNPALLARANNRVKERAKYATNDEHIERRRLLLLDFDTKLNGIKRPAGISSTDAEHETTIECARECRDWLKAQGWPMPVLADSGNGGHLLYKIDLPNDKQARELVERCLKSVAARFDDETTDVDKGVFNASRICKLYATLVCKGDSTTDRPHRVACILEAPESLETVPAEKLTALAAEIPEEPSRQKPGGRGGDDFFGNVNQAALSGLSSWVPRLFPDAKTYHDGYRVPSKALNRGLEEDLSLLPAGIRDFGEEAGKTPIDLVIQRLPAPDAKTAADWLCEQLGIDPASMGWKSRDPRQGDTKKAGRAEPPRDDVYSESLANGEAVANDDTDEDWLTPPPRATDGMLYGLVGDVARAAATGTEVNPIAVAAAYMSWLSARMGRDVFIPIGDTQHHIRLFTLHVGRSMVAGKGESVALIRRIEKAVRGPNDDGIPRPEQPSQWGWTHEGGLSSREGLAHLIRDTRYETTKDGDEKEIPGVLDKRLWIYESEFANVLSQSQREGNTLSSALRDCWDGIGIRPATKTARTWASNPHVAIHGSITPNELLSALSSREMTNGFANRFLIFWAERTGLIPFPLGRTEEEVEALADRTKEVIRHAAQRYPERQNTLELTLTQAAREAYADAYTALRKREPLGEVSALLDRRAPIAIRVAGLFALCDQSFTVTAEHIQAGHEWARYHLDSVRFIYGSLANRKQALLAERQGEKIVAYLQGKNWTPRSELTRKLFSGRISAQDLTTALQALLTDGVIEQREVINPNSPRRKTEYRCAKNAKNAKNGVNTGSAGLRKMAKNGEKWESGESADSSGLRNSAKPANPGENHEGDNDDAGNDSHFSQNSQDCEKCGDRMDSHFSQNSQNSQTHINKNGKSDSPDFADFADFADTQKQICGSCHHYQGDRGGTKTGRCPVMNLSVHPEVKPPACNKWVRLESSKGVRHG